MIKITFHAMSLNDKFIMIDAIRHHGNKWANWKFNILSFYI